MTTEIINVEELRQIVTATPYQPDHAPLVAALRERYPGSEFNLVGISGPWTRYSTSIVDGNGTVITDDFIGWLEAEYHAVGDKITVLFKKYIDSGIRQVEDEGTTIILTLPYGTDPDAFFQLEIHASQRLASRRVFDKSWPPDELDDLLHPFSGSDPLQLTLWAYEPEIRLTNARRFLQEVARTRYEEKLAEMPKVEKKVIHVVTVSPTERQKTQDVPFLEMHPDWLERPCNEVRLLADWQESSAGQHRFCDHWWLSLRDYGSHLGFIPYWATADSERVTEITTTEAESPYSLMGRLEEFDLAAGYPFAWYFYMLHGNKVHYAVGTKIVEGIKGGKIRLPDRDANVLLRWVERQYGF